MELYQPQERIMEDMRRQVLEEVEGMVRQDRQEQRRRPEAPRQNGEEQRPHAVEHLRNIDQRLQEAPQPREEPRQEEERRGQREGERRGEPFLARLVNEIPLVGDSWSQAKAWYRWAQCAPLVSMYLRLIEFVLWEAVRLLDPFVPSLFNEWEDVTCYLNKELERVKKRYPSVMLPSAEIYQRLTALVTRCWDWLVYQPCAKLLTMAVHPLETSVWVVGGWLRLCGLVLVAIVSIPGALVMAVVATVEFVLDAITCVGYWVRFAAIYVCCVVFCICAEKARRR